MGVWDGYYHKNLHDLGGLISVSVHSSMNISLRERCESHKTRRNFKRFGSVTLFIPRLGEEYRDSAEETSAS